LHPAEKTPPSVDEDHSTEDGSQASQRFLETVLWLYKGRLESFVGVAEAQLPFLIVAFRDVLGSSALDMKVVVVGP
jgi:hypothetical protein